MNDRMPGGEVDGELVLYPVADPWNWQLTLSGEQLTDETQMHNIEINKISLKKKKDEDGNPFYHFKMAFPTFDLPRALDVALRSGDDFPLIRYKDKTTPKDRSDQ